MVHSHHPALTLHDAMIMRKIFLGECRFVVVIAQCFAH